MVLLVSLLFTFECVSFTWEGICFLIKEFDRIILLLLKRWVYIFFPFSSHISSQGFKDDSFLFNTLLFLFIFNECLCALCTPKGAKIMIWLFVSCLTTQKTPQVTSVTSTADIIPIPEVQAHAGEVEEREKKLGINSDFTTFDQVLLDPELTIGDPKEQWFYTGMDCFIHCIESLNGTFLNAFSKSYGEKSLELCKEVFLENNTEAESREKLMMASWHGGMSIAYSQVGVAHAMSYGLGYVLGIKHGIGNCLVFQYLEEFYPQGVSLFKRMIERHNIKLPTGVCSNLSESEMDTMISVAIGMEPLWENALGKHWKELITAKKLKSIYQKI